MRHVKRLRVPPKNYNSGHNTAQQRHMLEWNGN